MWSFDSLDGSPVNCLAAHDILKSDVNDIIVGRDDGRVQVLRTNHEGVGLEISPTKSASQPASLTFERFLEESVRSVQGGCVSTPGYEEIVVCTYSGNLVSFTTERLDTVEESDDLGRSKLAVDVQGKVSNMRKDLDSLDAQITAAKGKLAKRGIEPQGIQKHITLNKRFALVPEEAVYHLSFELPVPIDLVLLQSSTPLKLLDSNHTNQQHGIVVSTGVPSAPGKFSQAVYRCTEQSKRIDVRLRTIEGEFGQLKVTVVANVQPKFAQQVVLEIKPLSLHSRIPSPSGVELKLSSLQVSGVFSLNQVHDWISALLPDVPTNPPFQESTAKASAPETDLPMVELWYTNALFQSLLCVRYREGLCIVESESLSAIAIAREVLSAEASRRKVNISIKSSIHPETIPGFLQKLDKLLVEHSKLARDVELIDALQELVADCNGDLSFLSQHDQYVVVNSATLRAKHASWPTALETLQGIIYDLYVDMKKFSGQTVRGPEAHQQLSRLLENYAFENLLDYFLPS